LRKWSALSKEMEEARSSRERLYTDKSLSYRFGGARGWRPFAAPVLVAGDYAEPRPVLLRP